MKEIWAIILAGGESKRMGFPKMLLIFNGKTMLENVIENVKSSKVSHTLVILGAELDRLKELVIKSSVIYCYNEDYKEGMLSSIKCGIRNLPPDYKAVLVFQGDQPLIKTATTNIIIEEYNSSDKGIVIPVYKNKRGHPILIDFKYNDEIKKIEATEGLRSLAIKFPGDVLEVETDDPGILRDFDTYEEYKIEINQKE